MEETKEELERCKKLAFYYSQILYLLGENPGRDGLLKTPERAARSMMYLTKGYFQDSKKILSSAIFREDYKQMIVVKDIVFFSLCEHHLLPFFGRAHVAYVPNGTVVGLSKIPRIVEVYARRLQIQERMTVQIKNSIQETLNPLGVMVVLKAQHMCMQMRGVEKQDSITTTSDFAGVFNKEKTREEFVNLLKRS